MNNEVEFLTIEVEAEMKLPYYPEGIRAGFPSPATDYEEEAIDLNRELIRHREATFYARVKGDSMIDAGIHPGDLLIVDRALEPKHGDIVVAFVGGEEDGFTIKELDLSERERGRVWLVPHNSAYERIQITPEQSSVIWGVVTYCIHSSLRHG
ncbi:MAG: translesion error-prone DNA polymerase V autoproteolytic subunit [Bacteroidaceae bacterium]|nr:translesion error-prone DNA polymerase V autoproteolytic subunit [Bacteroidaceae bacterium]